MKKIVCFLLAISLMLSLFVFSFADTQLIPVDKNDPLYFDFSPSSLSNGVTPYSLISPSQSPYIVTGRSGNSPVYTQLADNGNGLYIGSGGILTYIGSTSSAYQNAFFIRSSQYFPYNQANYWFNFIGKITDSNGYVLQSSDFQIYVVLSSYPTSLGASEGTQVVASDNTYQFQDGYLQIALSHDRWSYNNSTPSLAVNVSNPNVVAPLSFEIEKFDLYSNESSTTVYPFTFGAGAHTVVPPTPEVKDPNDHTQYGSASDQVEWYNDAFGGAVDPELDNKINAGNDMLLQQEEIEQDVIADFQQYSSQVDPANITFPTAVLNGMSFIGTTFMSSYNNLGDISFVISLSMMIGVVLVLIGRGEGALARGMSSSSRERRRTEYASERDIKKGG